MSRTRLVIPVLALAIAGSGTTAAFAKDGDTRVRGACSKASSAKLKLSADDGRIETEFEVDQNRTGVRWNVTLRRNGVLVTTTRATTRAPSGSFSVRRLLFNGRGADVVTARAVSPSGETCTARATF